MPRFYVQCPNGKWNIFSTVTDNYIYENLTLEDIERIRIQEVKKDIASLLTTTPNLNVMSFEEANERIATVAAAIEAGEDPKEMYSGCASCSRRYGDTCPDAFTEIAPFCTNYKSHEEAAQDKAAKQELRRTMEIRGIVKERAFPV